MSWVRRIAAKQRRCDNCWDVIDVEEEYYLMATGEKFCCECPPPELEEVECSL